jgi:hypothetical protein
MSKNSFKKLTKSNLIQNNFRFIESRFGNTVKSETKPQVPSDWTPNLLVKPVFDKQTPQEKSLLKSIKKDINILSPNQKKLNRDHIIEQIIKSHTPNFGSFHLNLS